MESQLLSRTTVRLMVNARAKGRAKRKPRTYTWAGELASSACMREQHYECTGRMNPGTRSHKDSRPCECGCHKMPARSAYEI